MADENENEVPKDLGDFIKNVFGSESAAEEFAQSLEDPMLEAWKGIHEIYTGLRMGGFTSTQADGVMGAYLYRLVTGIGEGGSQ